MDALILCGGFATRLEPITLFVPKPLLPIGGKPIIDYIVEDIEKFSVNRIVISTNRKFADQFEYWMKNKKARGLKGETEMVVEPTMHNGHKYGAIKGISHAINSAKLEDDLLIISGDNFYTFSIGNLIEHFKKKRKPTICAHDIGSVSGASRFGVVGVEGDIVKSFEEKPAEPKSSMVSTGIYAFPSESLGKFDEYLDGSNNPDAPGYFMQWLIGKEETHAIVYQGEWFDIGTIETYKRVFEEFHRERV